MPRRPPYLSAEGLLVLVVPDVDATRYRVVSFDGRGQWRMGTLWMSLAEARRERARLMRLHRSLAAKRKTGKR